MPRRADFDLGAIKTDLEFIMERLSNLPTRREVALRPAFSHRRECRTRHRLDRAFPTRLPIGSIMIGRHRSLSNGVWMAGYRSAAASCSRLVAGGARTASSAEERFSICDIIAADVDKLECRCIRETPVLAVTL